MFCAPDYPRMFVKMKLLGPYSKSTESKSPRWSLGLCVLTCTRGEMCPVRAENWWAETEAEDAEVRASSWACYCGGDPVITTQRPQGYQGDSGAGLNLRTTSKETEHRR